MGGAGDGRAGKGGGLGADDGSEVCFESLRSVCVDKRTAFASRWEGRVATLSDVSRLSKSSESSCATGLR